MELFNDLSDHYFNFYVVENEYTSMNFYISSNGHLAMDKYGRSFKTGTAASIELYLTHYVNLPAPYSNTPYNCQYTEKMSSNIANIMRSANISYDRYNCITFCQQYLFAKNSDCYYMSYPNPFGIRPCETYEETNKNRQDYVDYSECPSLCPPECELYDVSLSDFPSKNYAYKLINDRHDYYKRLFQTDNITYDMFAKSVSSFHFYFDELVITEITASPSVEFVDLISNIGGFFGLFIGLSVLSFVELIELAFNIAHLIIRVKRLRKNKS
jgi:hypothetical protein